MSAESESFSDQDYNGDSAKVVRYMAAFGLLFYGFAKLNGAQFTILDSELDKPMGEVNGFWLTWYYFGFSPIYGTFIALAQIGGAVMLTFQRTTLAGACVLAGILTNIIFIDVCFSIDAGATVVAALLLSGMFWLISLRWKELVALFWTPAGDLGHSIHANWKVWSLRISLLLGAFRLTYWTANYNNRAPTPLDGVWDVVQVSPAALNTQLPRTIFFEGNRAFMTVFKTSYGSYETHHFEIDQKNKAI